MGKGDQVEWFEAFDGYCERVDAAFWSEPINAVTNAALLIAAIWAWRRSELPVMGRVLTVILALIGIGSFFFNTIAQTWRVWPMFPDPDVHIGLYLCGNARLF